MKKVSVAGQEVGIFLDRIFLADLFILLNPPAPGTEENEKYGLYLFSLIRRVVDPADAEKLSLNRVPFLLKEIIAEALKETFTYTNNIEDEIERSSDD